MSLEETTLEYLYSLVGQVVLLEIPLGEKRPTLTAWQTITFADTQQPSYQQKLIQVIKRGGNIGVLLGPASNRLLALDIDQDNLIDEWINRCPWLANTLRSRGKRGCQFWLRLKPNCQYPNGKAVFKLKDNGREIGEIRLGDTFKGAQSVIFGNHPDGMSYEILVQKQPLEISAANLDELAPGVVCPGLQQPATPPAPHSISTPSDWPALFEKRLKPYLNKCPPSVAGNHGDDQLFTVACALVNGFALTAQEAVEGLRYFNAKCEPPWPEERLTYKAHQAVNAPHLKPRGYLLGHSGDHHNPSPQAPAKTELLDEHASELDRARVLKSKLPPIRCAGEDWYFYENGVWRRKDSHCLKPLALNIQDPKSRTSRKASLAITHLEFANQCDPQEFKSFCYFDEAGAILLNCNNTVLRVSREKTQCLPHSPDLLFTRQIAANYQPISTAPVFERVLQEALPNAEDLQLFQLCCGNFIYPDCRYETALVCYGPGGTGKSTVAEAIMTALGPDLVRHLSLEQICDPKTFHLKQLQNAAINIATELNTVSVGGETFKQLVSGESVEADRKYQDAFSLSTNCKFWILTNHLPRFKHGTDAELRRLRFLRFDKKPAQVDNTLKDKIAAETDGVLQFMLDGLRFLLQKAEIPHGGPESRHTRQRFQIQNDSIGTFIDTQCSLSGESQKDQLYHAYEAFCCENGIQPIEQSPFFKEIYSRYSFKNVRRNDGNLRVMKVAGVTLRE